ncbi:MAG: permease-like cell division protein FtsX, partial [Saprospiraceae bacterium]|nr:permease-like cell division protein FtsX [Saprospiraceae bacterium]
KNRIGIPKPKPNYFLSTVSIALVLFLLGLMALLSLNTNKLINSFKENVNLIAELRDSVPSGKIDTLKEFISSLEAVKASTVDIVTKEEALSIMKKEMGDDFLLDEMTNPLNDAIVFNVKADYLDSLQLAGIKTTILNAYDFVTNVYYQETFVGKVTETLSKIGIGILVISILFLLIALTVMHGTLKLSMYSNRFLIKNMQLVGASKGFIQRPFLWKGVWSGLLSALVACLMLSGVIWAAYLYIPDVSGIIDLNEVGILFGAILILGILITVISTFFIINRYIRLRREDMF